VEVVDSLPKTPSLRVQKVQLRQAGNSDATWDRLADNQREVRSVS
jgi:hypothetical protein